MIIIIIIIRRNLIATTAYLVKNSSNLKCQKVKLQGFEHISVLGRRRVGECSILQSSCCKSSPGRSETSDATGLLAVGFSLFSWRREITRRRRIFCPTSKPMSAKPRSVTVAKNDSEVTKFCARMSTISSGTSLEQNDKGKRSRRLFLALSFWEALRELDMRKEIWVILCQNRPRKYYEARAIAQTRNLPSVIILN